MKTYFLTVAFMLLACGLAMGQDKENTVRLNGTVYDLNGAVIVRATVSAEMAGDPKFQKSVKTDEKGEYAIDLQPGTYKLTFESGDGFKTLVFTDFRLVNAYTKRFQMDVALAGSCSDCDVLLAPEGPALKTESKVSTEITPRQPNKPKKP